METNNAALCISSDAEQKFSIITPSISNSVASDDATAASVAFSREALKLSIVCVCMCAIDFPMAD